MLIGSLAGGYYFVTMIHPHIVASFGGASYGFCDIFLKDSEGSELADFLRAPHVSPDRRTLTYCYVIFEDEKTLFIRPQELPSGGWDAAKGIEYSLNWEIPKDQILSIRYRYIPNNVYETHVPWEPSNSAAP
jgi:hypothetical protein